MKDTAAADGKGRSWRVAVLRHAWGEKSGVALWDGDGSAAPIVVTHWGLLGDPRKMGDPTHMERCAMPAAAPAYKAMCRLPAQNVVPLSRQ
eukprot:6212816-Pleurochrysis_carterae.AAC.2